MSGPPTYTRNSTTGLFLKGAPAAMAWGSAAGAVIGAGISLDIGLFYTSSTGLICAVVLVSALLGMMFGRGMAGLLSDEGMAGIAGLMTEHNRHFVTEHASQHAALRDYRQLRSELPARPLESGQQVPDIA